MISRTIAAASHGRCAGSPRRELGKLVASAGIGPTLTSMSTTAGPDGVNATPLAMMAPEQFQQACLVLGVVVVQQPSGRQEMAFAEEFGQVLVRMAECVAQGLGKDPQSETVRVAVLRMQQGLQSQAMSHDAFCASLPDGTPLVIVRNEVLRTQSPSAVVRQAHMAQVQRALAVSASVNPDCLREYGLEPAGQRERSPGSLVSAS